MPQEYNTFNFIKQNLKVNVVGHFYTTMMVQPFKMMIQIGTESYILVGPIFI